MDVPYIETTSACGSYNPTSMLVVILSPGEKNIVCVTYSEANMAKNLLLLSGRGEGFLCLKVFFYCSFNACFNAVAN